MRLWTYKEARDKILLDMDLTEEDFITPNELIGYFNEAIREAESEIHKIHEDYFLSKAVLPLVGAQAEYDLPTDIYANKVRALIYNANTTNIYPIRRIRTIEKFWDSAVTNVYGTSDDYRYLIRNDAATGYKIVLFPASRETGNVVDVWYLRAANRLPLIGETKPAPLVGVYSVAEVEAFEIDIPEFISFVLKFVKVRCMDKEGDPRQELGLQILQQQRKQMVDTLTQMVVDDDDTVIQDMSHYAEHQ
jgi:hypothetical protein